MPKTPQEAENAAKNASLRPRAHQRHETGPCNDRSAGLGPLPPLELDITLHAQEILCEQLHQPREQQQPAGQRVKPMISRR